MISINTVMVLIEGVCLAFMLVLAYAVFFENRVDTERGRIYSYSVLGVCIMLFVDIISWAFDGDPGKIIILNITNPLSMVLGEIEMGIFAYYMRAVINEKREKPMSIWESRGALIFDIAVVIAVFILHLMGKIFIVDGAVFNPGPMYNFGSVACLVNIIFLFAIVLINARYIGVHDSIALGAYGIIPIMGIILEVVFSPMTFSFAATAVAALLVFVMLQSSQVQTLNLMGRTLNKLSYTDSLTGRLNRRAYDEAIASDFGKVSLGVLFCDVNGLKYTNDNLGHKAGDELLVRFSNLAAANFSADCIYRISGDEFVIIFSGISRENFEKRAKNFIAIVEENDEIASVGYTFGSSKDVLAMIGEAEDSMYEMKEKYYEKHPEQHRR